MQALVNPAAVLGLLLVLVVQVVGSRRIGRKGLAIRLSQVLQFLPLVDGLTREHNRHDETDFGSITIIGCQVLRPITVNTNY